MTNDSTKEAAVAGEVFLFDYWFDVIEDGVRAHVRGFIEGMLEEEFSDLLSRPCYGRRKLGKGEGAPTAVGVRHGNRERPPTGTFDITRIAVPRAWLVGGDGKTCEWRSAALPAYRRRPPVADALIDGAYRAATNTRRVRRALAAAFAGSVGEVSRTWRKVKGDWDAWNSRSLIDEPIFRLIFDGTVARVRLDARRPRSRCWSRSACRQTARKCCLLSRSWVGKSRRPGAR